MRAGNNADRPADTPAKMPRIRRPIERDLRAAGAVDAEVAVLMGPNIYTEMAKVRKAKVKGVPNQS